MMRNLLLPAALLFATRMATAQDTVSFEDLDIDADGALSVDEASVLQGLDFASVDTDSDGSISVEEFAVMING